MYLVTSQTLSGVFREKLLHDFWVMAQVQHPKQLTEPSNSCWRPNSLQLWVSGKRELDKETGREGVSLPYCSGWRDRYSGGWKKKSLFYIIWNYCYSCWHFHIMLYNIWKSWWYFELNVGTSCDLCHSGTQWSKCFFNSQISMFNEHRGTARVATGKQGSLAGAAQPWPSARSPSLYLLHPHGTFLVWNFKNFASAPWISRPSHLYCKWVESMRSREMKQPLLGERRG